jgi:hypothetical protein
VAHLVSLGDHCGALTDRNPLWDMGLAMLAAVAARQPLAVRTRQRRDELARLDVDPLVDRFVAHAFAASELDPATRDELGRPAGLELAADVASQPNRLQAALLVARLPAIRSALLGTVREVTAGVYRRAVTLELAGERRWAAFQTSRNLS